MRYFTSDWHLNSNNIIKYAKRPFFDAQYMNDLLIQDTNLRLDRGDTLIHVGDFILVGFDRHDKKCGHDKGSKMDNAEYMLSRLRPNVILLSGNHDDGHNCETAGKMMVIDLNKHWKNVTVSHYPSYSKDYFGRYGTVAQTHVHLCGHVHDKWLLYWDDDVHVLNINVGVDVWNYKPVCDSDLIQILDFVTHAKVKMPKHYLTCAEYHIWQKQNECIVAVQRAERKADKYAIKGLTPQECERRKIEAMKKKGLI